MLPDGTDPYGRFLEVIRKISGGASPNGIVKGEYMGGKKFSIGSHTFTDKEVSILQNEIEIDGKTFKIPGYEDQEKTIKKTVTIGGESDDIEIDVKVPKLKKGDSVIAYQFGSEEYVIIGKVV